MIVALTTHPIQYQIPLWRRLATEFGSEFEVWYLTDHAVKPSFDREFGENFAWDMTGGVLSGYKHRFLEINSDWDIHPSKFFGIRLQKSLRPLLRDSKVRVLWIQGWQKYAYWQAARDAHSLGLRVLLRGESNDLAPIPGWKSAIKKMLLARLFGKVDRFMAIGTANRRLYLQMGVKAPRIVDAPYFVDNDRFSASAEQLRSQRSLIREQWAIPAEAKCVLFCGKFISKKRPLDVVGAVSRLRDSYPGFPVHILFVGSGELEGAIKSQVMVTFDRKAGLSPVTAVQGGGDLRPTASFAGFLNQSEISKAYVAADVLVLASDYGETWGLVVNEALASGVVCVVSSACGCSEDLVAPIDPRLVYPLGDTARLSEAVKVALSESWTPAAWAPLLRRNSIDTSVSAVKSILP